MQFWFRASRMALALAIFGVASSLSFTVAASASSVPFTDSNANGYLTLCNRDQQPVTSGSLLTVPFVWSAVSSTPAPKGYTRAYLVVYQPIQYIDPGDWSGYQLTEDSIFTNRAHPIAQATNGDPPLVWADHTLPPRWEGYFEIRMYFTSPNLPAYVTPYPVDVIHVSGNNWSLVDPGRAIPCNIGKSVSRESLVLPSSELSSPQSLVVGPVPARSSSPKEGASAPPTSATSQKNSKASSSSDGALAQAGSAEASSSGGGSSGGLSGAAIAAIAIAVVIIATAVTLFLRNKRRGSGPVAQDGAG
jgi:uncharacterized membrane protein YgcG